MSRTTLGLPDTLQTYIESVTPQEPKQMRLIRLASDRLAQANMRSAQEQVQFMRQLLALMGAQRVLEVGVFTGYATLGFALSLPQNGQVIALDVTDTWLEEGRRQWRNAGVVHRIDLRLGPALESLDEMIAVGEEGSLDFAFIDADKPNYVDYYERCLTLIRRNGLIAIDNTLWSGRVADPAFTDADTQGIRRLNEALAGDDRVEVSLLPIGDGLTLARVL